MPLPLAFAAAFGLLFMLGLYLLVALPVTFTIARRLPASRYRRPLQWVLVVGVVVSSPWVVGSWMYGPRCMDRGLPLTVPVVTLNGEACADCTIEFCRRCVARVRSGDRLLGTLRWTQHTDPESPDPYYKIGERGRMVHLGYPPREMHLVLSETAAAE